MGKFDPEKINPHLNPNINKSTQDFAVVDILFEVTEISK